MGQGEWTTDEYERVESLVGSRLPIRERYLREDGSLEFSVNPTSTLKQAFVEVVGQIKPMGFVPFLGRTDGGVTLLVVKGSFTAKFSPRTPAILFVITLLTVMVDGWLRVVSFMEVSNVPINPPFFTLLYMAGIMGIIGTHEMGHKIASSTRGVRSSLPYFIPGIPGFLPTLGAVITSGEPPMNRDALFDLGISGPMSGLVVTLIVAVPGALTSVLIPPSELPEGGVLNMGFVTLLALILELTGKMQVEMVVLLSPLGFAAWLGFLITFLNLLPAWQLDGGHIARATLGRGKHGLTTMLSIIVLILLGFWFMALLLLFLSTRRVEMRPLDDITPLSRRRKFIFVAVLILAVVLAPLPL